MPHTWVGSDFVRSVLDMFAYERESDDALVIGAGLPAAWVSKAPGVAVRKLPTPYGPLWFTMQARGDSTVLTIDSGVRIPGGRIVVNAPSSRPSPSATINGVRAPIARDGQVVVRRIPARVVLWSDARR